MVVECYFELHHSDIHLPNKVEVEIAEAPTVTKAEIKNALRSMMREERRLIRLY